MKSILLLLVPIFGFYSFGQSNDCSTATSLTIFANCASPISGTTTGATQSIPGCTGNADDDVWYSFVATSTAHQITVDPSAGMDPVVQVFANTCGILNSLGCFDNNVTGASEILTLSSLTIGTTYRIRVYHYGVGAGTGTFDICITNAAPPPSNNNCLGATSLTVNGACVATAGTTNGATQSLPGCAGNADDDVWYSFVATSSVQQVTVAPTANIDPVVQIYSGTCGSLTSLSCTDNTMSSMNEVVNLVGLTVGQTYFIRVYDYWFATSGNFTICVQGSVTAVPSNDNPCNAIAMPPVTANCTYSVFTNVGATSTPVGQAPTPFSCAGGGGAMIGGYNASTADVWFSITVPSSGKLHISSKPNMGAGSITDGVMALYSGTCSGLTQIACSDDNAAYPGASNDMLPLISASGLVPGTTVYLRYWGFNTNQGTFGFCITTATNDDCANALYICDLNGYSASTSGAYTADRPGNMFGNNETAAGVNQTNGINTGGVFGYYPYPGTTPGPFSSPALDVNIENNSWIKFTAAATSATLTVSVFDCWVGNYPSGGIQMQIFDGTNCNNFVPVSNFAENSTGFTITGNGLTIGNDYYLMIDGYAGDICNYTISAESGVQFPDIADVAPICPGESVTLTAPAGATSYYWQHNGSTAQSIVVTPATSQTYYCIVNGLCDYSQTLEVDVTLKPLPIVEINNGNPVVICQGESVNLTASGATSYSWNTGSNNVAITVNPTTSTLFTVTGTLNGCTDNANVNVVVNNPPTLNAGALVTAADCGTPNGSVTNVSATGTPTLTYTWTNISNAVIGNSPNLSNVVSGNYFLNVTDGNGCELDQSFNISVLNFDNPTFTVSDVTPCIGSTITLTAAHSDGTASFVWSGPGINGTNNTLNPVTITTTTSGNSNYSVTASIPGCSASSANQIVNVQSLPSIDIQAMNNDSTICRNGTAILTATGGVNYSWSGPNGFSSVNNPITIAPFTDANIGFYSVLGTDANGCINLAEIELNLVELPSLNLTTDNANGIYCSDATIQLSVTGAQDYSWSGPNGFNSIQSNPTIFSANSVNQGWYIVTATDPNNCSNTDSVFVAIDVNSTAAAASSDSIICPGEDVAFYGSGGETYSWTGPLGFTTQESSFTIYATTLSNSGWYYLNTTDENGCFASDSTYLVVAPNAGCLKIPDLTTPDGDNHNDTWHIEGLENFVNCEVEIYNRWGNLVFKAKPYLNDWDGTVNHGATIGATGKVPVGTYFYILTLNDEENTPPYKGYLEVQY